MLKSMLLFFSISHALECLNEQNKPVDAWVAIKKPRGTSYFYYDSEDKQFYSSPNSLNNTFTGALTHTTKQLWHKDANYAIYNDQVPKKAINDSDSGKFGHSKGFFAFDTNNDNGFWLTHSIPLFPVGPKTTNVYLGLGSNAWTYAQHLLCLSVKADVINELAKKFLLNRPQLYDAKLTTTKYEYIKHLIDGSYSTLPQCESSILSTKAGMPFKIFSKTAEWNNDLYAGCVTPTEKDTLWVESWIRGSAEGAVCPLSDYDTLDIKYLNFSAGGGRYRRNDTSSYRSIGNGSNQWSETQDHSKWAITANKQTICMGDINRMTTQYSRGGGTACFSDEILHAVFKSATIDKNSCKSTKNKTI